MLIGYWGVYTYVFTTPYFGGVVFFHTAKPLLQADDVFLWSVFAHGPFNFEFLMLNF